MKLTKIFKEVITNSLPLICVLVVAIVIFFPSVARADDFPYKLGVSTTEGMTMGEGGYTLTESCLETVDGEPLFWLLPFRGRNILILDSSLATSLNMTELFYDLGPKTDSYTLSMLNVDYRNIPSTSFPYMGHDPVDGVFKERTGQAVTNGNFTGIGVNWYQEIHKGDTILIGIYGDGDSDFLGKVEANISVFEGDNYRVHGLVFYDNKSFHGYGELRHPVTENAYMAVGYYNGVWGLGAGFNF